MNPPKTKFPELHSQVGITGVCLDDAHGYVFVTYSVYDAKGVQRSRIVRFATRPRTFALAPRGRVDLSGPMDPYPTQPNHQIGSCTVADGSLWVGVGDGGIPRRSHDLDDLVGKVLRFTLDGKPDPRNPFARSAGSRRYVWAYGLRNPFGVAVVKGEVFVTHNGLSVDAFLRVRRGVDHGWNGTDPSIAANADAVIVPSVGPAHVAYYPAASTLFPARYGSSFFFATSVGSAERGAGVWRLRYDFSSGRVSDPPAIFIRSRSAVAAVALGPDGLYLAAIEPNSDGETPVYRVRYAPGARYPHPLEVGGSGPELFLQFGCRECHTLQGLGGTSAPNLDKDPLVDRISDRLGSPEYRQTVAALDGRQDQPFVSFRKARHQVLTATGTSRIALWIKYRIMQPRFDDPNATMPKLGVDRRQAEILADYLLGRNQPEAAGAERSFVDRARDVTTSKKFVAGFVGGFGVAALVAVAAVLLIGLRRR